MHQFGFIRLCAATPPCRVANPRANAAAILAQYREAAQNGAALAVFPELCLTGYTCEDLFHQQRLLDGALEGLQTILAGTGDLATLALVGLPLRRGDHLYNCAALLQGGRILGVIPKQHLPNYGEFYEQRHFRPGTPLENGELTLLGQTVPFGTDLLFCCQDLPEFRLGVELCEDLWAPVPPSATLAQAGATVIANLSASNETVGKADYRRTLIRSHSARLLCAYAYADAGNGESSTDLVFAGHNLIGENGVLLGESSLFSQGLTYGDCDLGLLAHERMRMHTFAPPAQAFRAIPFTLAMEGPPHLAYRQVSPQPFLPHGQQAQALRCEQILAMQAQGLAKRVAHTRAKRLVIGISGGLDSCLALLVSVRALSLLQRPARDALAITMPCFGTTGRTRSNAQALCEALGTDFRCIDIGPAVRQHFQDIGQAYENQDVTFENSQARERTQVLMDVANMEGGLVIGTGDLSELALGWATYNGDHMSMYGVNAGVPKTLVRHLVAHCAATAVSQDLSQVLRDILDTPVSPELLPAQNGRIAQVTEDLVGPYQLHDFFLYHMLRYGTPPDKLRFLANTAFQGVYDPATIDAWLHTFLRRFFAQQFKRSCLPDGPKIGSVALSPRGDWRMPSDAEAAIWLE